MENVIVCILIAIVVIIVCTIKLIKDIKTKGIKGCIKESKIAYENYEKSKIEFKESWNKAFPKKVHEFKCPKCGSKHIYTYKRGFKTGRFVVGTMFLGALDGTILGLIGKDKIKHKCLECGKVWNSK